MSRRPDQSSSATTVVLVGILLVSVIALLGIGFLLVRSTTGDSDPDREAAISLTATTATVAIPTETPSEGEIVRRAVESIVKVYAPQSQGTGFNYEVIGIDTFFVTNAHVIGDAQQVTIVGSDGIEHVADVWMADMSRDLAIVRVAGITDIPALPRGDADALALGDDLYVIGYALGGDLLGDPSLSRGIVSGRRLLGEIDYLQTDAAMNPGNSGGPVINASGQVVGIATAAIRDSNGRVIEGINFAIPINAVGAVPESPMTGSGTSPIVVPTRDPVTRPDIDPIPTPTPRPTATPRPSTAGQGVPSEGNVLYNVPLSEWRSEEHYSGNGWTAATSNSLNIGVYGVGEQRTVGVWTDRDGLGDISASVEVRALNPGNESSACISVRHSVDFGDYSLCITGDGQTRATYDYADSQGNWHSETLLRTALRSEARAANQWNALKVYARGDELWFVVNDRVVGTVQHGARSSGSVALYVTNWDAETTAFDFKNLIVRVVR